tara:strand:- start:332 stop:1297 length:966 start_codon:yes stop_codon:yes gene_type:complete
MKIKPDLTGFSEKDKVFIEENLPTPKVYAGWKFEKYRWVNPASLNTKHSGFTDNSVRRGGTPDNESLEELLRRGLDVTKLTISICPKNDVINGFTRVGDLIKIGYQEWIVAVYVKDEDTKTEFQDAKEDYLDDMRLGANEGDGSTPATTSDFMEIGKKRFEKRKDKSNLAVARWVNSISHSFSKKQVEAIANHVSKFHKRQGVVEKIEREDAEKLMQKLYPGAEVLNTKSPTYAVRLWNKIVKATVGNKGAIEFGTFHSDATTHEEVEEGRNSVDSIITQLHKDSLAYADAYYRTHKINWKNLGALAQKIGKETANTLVQK